MQLTQPQKSKFDQRSHRCVLIDYPTGVKAYKLYNLDTKSVCTSRDVVFKETTFPFSTTTENFQTPLPNPHLETVIENTTETFQTPLPNPHHETVVENTTASIMPLSLNEIPQNHNSPNQNQTVI